jgi:N6-adenosine-specific RNA methylase IME4
LFACLPWKTKISQKQFWFRLFGLKFYFIIILEGVREVKKYNIIYADPPWQYNARKNTGTAFGGGAMKHYPTMPTYEIKKMDVASLAADNCALFMWCTFPQLPHQLEVLEAWGFDFKTVAFTWVKTNKNNPRPFFGVGYYTKSNAEICVLGIKGKMKPVSNCVSQIVMTPIQRHSQKPAVIRDKIVELFGDIPRVELFARETAQGWDVWGNEVLSDIELETITQ